MMIILIFIFSSFFLLDIIQHVFLWQSRIHIGKWSDKIAWKNAVFSQTEKWLLHTPKVKLTDNSRLIVLDILKGNYTKKTIQYWQEAALLLALIDLYKATKNERTKFKINVFLASKLKENGDWNTEIQSIDALILAFALMQIPWLDSNKYQPAFDKAYQFALAQKEADNMIRYREHMKNYRYVDTVGFVVPFLCKYGQMYANQTAIDLALLQLKTYFANGFLDTLKIPVHAYKIPNNIPVGLYGWGRGFAWYVLALGELLEFNTSDISVDLLLISNSVAASIISLQQENGSWSWLLTDESSRSDSSTTAVFTWFLLDKRINTLEGSANAAQNGLVYLQSVTRRDGTLDYSQGGTKALGVYAKTFERLPFSQGMLSRAILRNDAQ